MIQVLWLGPPRDADDPDQVTIALRTVSQAEELYARLRNEADRMKADGKPGQLILKGRFRK